MLGAVQLGLLAASFVLFVPMGMAGWHLSRNKMLFFSCALFITLAVGVHLMPYLVSYSSFLSPPDVLSPSPFHRDSCLSSLHSIAFRDVRGGCDDVDISGDDSSCGKKKSWDWVDNGCEFHRLGKSDVSVLLNGSWIVIAGDSQARLMAVSLLELVMGSDGVEKIRGDLFKRHSDYSVVVDGVGMKLDFVWAPFIANLTEFMGRVRSSNAIPDVVVIGSGLWDMLHLHNASAYGASLGEFRNSALTLLPVDTSDGGSNRPKPNWLLHLFWVGMPKLVTEMLNTAEKREIMTELMCELYNDEVIKSKILRESGGPFWKLDVRSLSESCGPRCTADGMHYGAVVYDAAVQIMLNVLLVESNQQTL